MPRLLKKLVLTELLQSKSLLNSIGTGKDILIIADQVQSVALATLAQNALSKVANIACVQNPYSASRAREFLFDMAALTGATVISEEKGMRLDEATVELCGRAEKVIATKDNTTIIGGKPRVIVHKTSEVGKSTMPINMTNDLEARIKSIEDEIANTTSEYSKLMLQERLAQLTGGIGVIRVGAYTDTEFNSKKYKFDNAINATQAALQEGILPGGGTALSHIATKITEKMFQRTLSTPFFQMMKNAGMDSVGHAQTEDGQMGIDFRNKQIVNMFDAGIIDPFKVVRLALESATAIASSLVSIETAIVNEDEKDGKQ